jgi:hypothetical protein
MRRGGRDGYSESFIRDQTTTSALAGTNDQIFNHRETMIQGGT